VQHVAYPNTAIADADEWMGYDSGAGSSASQSAGPAKLYGTMLDGFV
jgi:hypothetical protein